MISSEPWVSIFCHVKNSGGTIQRCVESILAQEYPKVEFIVQDGASTDDTLKILRDYHDRFQGRMKVVTEVDSSPEQGMFRAVKRCTGDIIGSCLADEELLPHACKWAVEVFQDNPDCGAIYGDCYLTDQDGVVTGGALDEREFNFAMYLFHEIVPPFSASFFKSTAIEAAGLRTYPWGTGGGEFEWWVRLGQAFPIKHIPGFVAKYMLTPDTRTMRAEIYNELIEPRTEVIERFFSNPELDEDVRALKSSSLAGMRIWAAESCINCRAFPEAKAHLVKAREFHPNLRIEFYDKVVRRLKDQWPEGTHDL